MKKKYSFVFLTLILFCGFNNTQAQTKKPLPEGAIPIVYPNSNGFYIQAKINDSVEGNFLFDTGAGNLSFDQTFYNTSFRRFGFSGFRYGEVRVGGVGTGGAQIVPRILDTLDFKFGSYIFRTTNVYIANRKPAQGDFYDGLIGQQYFSENKFVMEVSYVDEYMILHNDINSVDLSGYTKTDMKKQNRVGGFHFFVPIKIRVNDTLIIEDDFLFDTGAGGAIHISTTTAEKYNLPTLNIDKNRSVLYPAGFSGRTTMVDFKANSVEIGGHKLDDVRLLYSEDQSGSMTRPGGLLGNRILQNFDMIIDFGDAPALYLKPNRNFGVPFEDISAYRGFNYADRSQTLKGWVVRVLFDDSPAEKSGMQFGDKIISANGICVLEIPFEKQQDFWRNLDRVELVVLRDGEEMKFEFEMARFCTNL